jgi:hypothetical protein
MSSRPVIILKVAFQDATQMMFAEHNNMIGALAPDRADEPLYIWGLPRTVWCSDYFLNLHPCHLEAKFFSVDLISISE